MSEPVDLKLIAAHDLLDALTDFEKAVEHALRFADYPLPINFADSTAETLAEVAHEALRHFGPTFMEKLRDRLNA